MKRRDLIVIGASAGGSAASRQLAAGLPGDLAATSFVVGHSSPDSPGLLPDQRHGGVAIVQDLDEAIVRNLPASAVQHVDVD